MAGTSGCSRQLKRLKLSDGSSCAMGASDESEYVTASASQVNHATMASSFVSAEGKSIADSEKSGPSMSVEEQIEKSKSHWSLLTDYSSDEDGEVAEVSNVQEFRALQMHPIWGGFFHTFGYEFDNGRFVRVGELVMGKKFAEGGQAEIYDVQITWNNPKDDSKGLEWVLKVFRKGTFLKHLKSKLPEGLLQHSMEVLNNYNSATPEIFPLYCCSVQCGVLLEDGRFAFLMQKEHMDLRNLIEHSMELRSGLNGGPFPKEEWELMMYDVALGLDWLHSRNIVHRDLKASNVLVREFQGTWPKRSCYVADYECSIGVVGTGFFRAPEILQACEDGKISQRPEVFSRAADVYSYGMVCYEILTGKLPFEGHPLQHHRKKLTDKVVNEHLRPDVPEYVEDWAKVLLNWCWECEPTVRPTVDEILYVLVANSFLVGCLERYLIEKYGKNFRRHSFLVKNLDRNLMISFAKFFRW
ncbi:hypothetical protein KC19_10G050200 [Ceratodon purpureus]|uniref:Protein kinase domain-containing protein n=1 Tax=Ceratodon purpureus TaxID=3225 RepID=A0A8T0GHB5_CERPU|nr:hypothetical protein KC19_10G050200 [Ceratodon purpureus]